MKNSVIIFAVLVHLFATCSNQKDSDLSARHQESLFTQPHIEEKVRFTNSRDGARLAGTLTIPESKEEFPAVVLISGSGLQDRDETLYNQKPFKVLADYLTRRNIAVLRYDDRGAGASTGPMENITPENFAHDAYSGLLYLKSRKDLRISGIGLIGHSIGAVEGSILASRCDDIAFLVMLGGPGIPLDLNLLKADSVNNLRSGKSMDVITSGQILLKRMISEVKKGRSSRITETRLNGIIDQWRESLPAGVREGIDLFTKSKPGHWREMASEWSTPYFRYVLTFDPYPVLLKIACPVLSFIGEKDVQTLPEENSFRIKDALVNGACTNYRVEIIEGVNHLFQKCETGLISEYAKLEETFDAGVMEKISAWIRERTGESSHAKARHLEFSRYTDPGKYGYLYDGLPGPLEQLCDRIKKQLIHPFDLEKFSENIPRDRVYEDRAIPSVSQMLAELVNRDENGLASSRRPEDRLVVACVHHSMLLASILRHRGIPVRIRAGYAKYIGDDDNIRVSHVVCEVWDRKRNEWFLVDPDRRRVDFPRHQFEFAHETWERLKSRDLNEKHYVSRYSTVDQATVHLLCHDLSYVIGDEELYWHDPPVVGKARAGISALSQDQLQLLDKIAGMLKEPDIHLDELGGIQEEVSLLSYSEGP